MKIPAGTIKRLHVNQHVIRGWRKGKAEPAITIQTSKGSIRCAEAQIKGPSRFIQSPDKPLGCGARLWVETHAEIEYRRGEENERISD